jgi:hypothetical protein
VTSDLVDSTQYDFVLPYPFRLWTQGGGFEFLVFNFWGGFFPRKLCRVNLEADDEHSMPILPAYLLQEMLLERS